MKQPFSIVRSFWRSDFAQYRFITTVSFFLLVLIGFFAGQWIQGLAENVMNWFSQLISQAGVVEDDGDFDVIALFFNNFRAMLLGILYGLIPFLFLPAVNLGFNALIVGLLGSVYYQSDIGLLVYLAGIVPHGIFEISALILSIACGLYLCRTVTSFVKHNEKGSVRTACIRVLWLFVLVILPLLIIAAVVECYVTPEVIELFL